MKKPSATRKTSTPAQAKPDSLTTLLTEVRQLIQSARHSVSTIVDTFQVMTNFEIGRRIIEHEQKGTKRAAYGTKLLKELSARLTEEFGRGFSEDNLSNMRRFYLMFEDRVAEFPNRLFGNLQQPAGRLIDTGIPQKASGKLSPIKIRQQPIGKSEALQKGQLLSNSLAISEQPIRKSPFTLSWTHYQVLLTVKDPSERSFYEIEATNSGWSVPELKRQKASCLYERLALSRDKEGIRKLAREGQVIVRPEDLLKEPFVLEFLGLDDKDSYSENDLEQAIIDRLEHFLLELGKGFLFEARQKRFTFDEDHYFVDLVFYNRLLRCYVIIDLKLDKLTHQDLGQMQMYVNYYDREVKLPDENPTIGLLLCKSAKKTVVELTLPKGTNIHAKEYNLYLPSKELLTQKLNEWSATAAG
ncbi:PDDEXK nuclease domain-containing protein [Prosthecobacter sp.]|uniref:PDDEXK nuclease domain-containing protein n=1 Tax=Prosthecobacter sp. TaxID=1965333 RepID=UPI002489FFFA|nr:PDDEXK nuclease domain-containing protein [Prosthecobacter sp.]MDI1314354.1 PDDEXK nuclease domain-containing protein [Prosthecobacter sp.]